MSPHDVNFHLRHPIQCEYATTTFKNCCCLSIPHHLIFSKEKIIMVRAEKPSLKPQLSIAWNEVVLSVQMLFYSLYGHANSWAVFGGLAM